MNIESLLPLLMGKDNGNFLKIITALKTGDKTKAIQSLMPEDKAAELSAMMNLTKKPPADGLSAIEDFASNEILGILIRYFS